MSEQAAVARTVTSADSAGARGRVVALDGLRGVAVLAVMLFHIGASPLQGGYLGVDVFFVLSGFLITAILLREVRNRGWRSLGGFWLRRARRLAPALLLVVLLLAVQRLLDAGSSGSATTGQLLAALTYTTNWFEIATGGDYFGQFVAPSPLLHTWSLAIEEQFYIVFALLLALLLPRVGRMSRLAAILGGLALASAAAMWVSAEQGALTWAYYSTFSRIQALLIGGLLTLWLIARPTTGAKLRQPLAITAGVLLVIVMVHTPDGLFSGGFSMVALLTAVLIWGLTSAGVLSRLFSWRPLVALGTISYGVYLWHWPVFLWLGATDGDTPLHTQAWAFVLTILVAMASFHFLERPVREGGFTRLAARTQWLTYLAVAAVIAAVSLLPQPGSGDAKELSWPSSQRLPTSIATSGDSTLLVLNQGFPGDLYPQIRVAGVTKIGCGWMSEPRWRAGAAEQPTDCLAWRQQWQDFAASSDASVAVIGSPVWDTFDRVVDGQPAPPGTPAFDQAYTAAVRDAAVIAGKNGAAQVYVLGIPCFNAVIDADILNDARRREAINALTASAVADLPGVHYVDTTALTCDRGSSISGERAAAVYRDGVHWSVGGARELWSLLLTQMAADRSTATPTPSMTP